MQGGDNMALLTVTGLEKRFGGVTAIAGLDFQVEPEIVFAIIGPNGAGKTTLFNLLTSIYEPTAGTVTFDGHELTRLKPYQIARLGVTRTFQNLQVFLNMTVIENVMVGCHLRSRCGIVEAALRLPSVLREEKKVREMAMEALEFCGLEDIANRDASSLPYGMLKKLEVARALAAKPRMLLMDEPAAGLNDTETMVMSNLIRDIRGSGITVLLVEHNMGLVMEVSDRVLVLNYGELLSQGTPQEVQCDPRVIAAYLGE